MKYTGRFKNVNGETIQVNIITNNDQSQETELTFANESPVVIVQDSRDGIFSPIKSRSCTITIVAQEPYYDMYSGTSHGTKIVVNNLGTGECLFYGYLTPCEYNQPYLYLNVIELEAVDAVSTLQDFKYELVNSSESNIRTIKDIVVYCLYNIAGYNGGIYIPQFGLKSQKAFNNGFYPMEIECLSEEIFVGDKEEDNLSCYEVLEEICNFYNLSLVPYGNDVYFIDYSVVKETDYRYQLGNNTDIKWKDLRLNQIIPTNTSKFINKEDYAGDDQNIELDEVYNKISIEADVKELEENDILYDPVDDADKASFYESTYEVRTRSKNNQEWTYYIGLFEFIKGSNYAPENTTSNWQTLFNSNAFWNANNNTYVLTNNFTTQNLSAASWVNFPYLSGGNLNHDVNSQGCLLSKVFGYKSSEDVPYKADWNNMLMFFPQAQWINEYYKANGYISYSGNNLKEFWEGDFYERHLGGTYPVLKYRGNKIINFSPATSYGHTNYLLFTGNILWQQNCNYDDVNYHIWNTSDYNSNNHEYYGTWIPIKEHGASETHTTSGYTRATSHQEYNTGWPMLKIKLKIGNKYWNGTSWTTTESTAWINYHKKNVSTEYETLIWSDFNKPVTNYDFNKGIDKEGYIIPIGYSDNLLGKISLDIYMPRIPWTNGVLYSVSSNKYLIDFVKTPPVIFMENLSMELISTSTSTIWDMTRIPAKSDDDDDIIYSNDINTNNVSEFDSLKLKINTYNEKKPISLSYLLEPLITNNQADLNQVNYHTAGFYDYYANITEQQENNIIRRYRNHYSSPKKIYNCQVHNYYEPWLCVHPNVLKYNDLNPIYMIVDSQEYDVKSNVNNLKLIEY